MIDLSDRMRGVDEARRAQAIAWILSTYKRLGSIEAVASEAGVHARTVHRYIEAHDELRAGLARAGHVFRAGNVARRVREGRERVIAMLETLHDGGGFDVDGIAAALEVTPTTVLRWMRVYPGVRAIVKRKGGA